MKLLGGDWGTEAEEALGYQLKTHMIRYRREVKIPIEGKGLNYAKVDFLIEGWLVVEVDGPSHNNSQQKAFDRKKENALRKLNFAVLRVKNDAVLHGYAMHEIINAIGRGRPRKRVAESQLESKPETPEVPKKYPPPELYVKLPDGTSKTFPTREAYERWLVTWKKETQKRKGLG